MGNKKCSRCNITKVIHDFHKWKYGPDGYRRECKECRKIDSKSYYNKNSEKVKLTVTEYRKNNPDKIKEVKKRIYERDKEKILLLNKVYRENNREKRNEYTKSRKLIDPIFKLKHLIGSRMRVFMKSNNITKKK